MKKTLKHAKTLVLCILCFALGLSIPMAISQFQSKASFEKEKLNTIYKVLTNDWYYSDSIEDLDTELMESAIDGMTRIEKDPHTNYFDLETAQQFASELEGSNVGLGFSYYKNEKGNLLIKEVFMNSGAYQAGLKAGDVIISIDGQEVSKLSDKETIEIIQANEGKKLDVEYTRKSETRTTTAIPSVYDTSVALQLFKDYGYISVNSFSEQTGTEFADAMKEVKKQGLKKVILDLRGNAGGYLYATLEVASSLLKQDSVVFLEEDKDKNIIEKKANADFEMVELDKLVILQNGGTASASEALIGGLKYHLKDKVVTVGTTTYGKGTEQTQVPFKDGTALKYTVARWLAPDKTSINEKGWKPDVEVKTEAFRSTSYKDLEKDEVIKKDSVHTNAKALQVYLKYLGYDVDRTDTYFSITSAKALSKFQSENGLPASGDCDQKTWDALSDAILQKMNKEGLSNDRQYKKAVEQL